LNLEVKDGWRKCLKSFIGLNLDVDECEEVVELRNVGRISLTVKKLLRLINYLFYLQVGYISQ